MIPGDKQTCLVVLGGILFIAIALILIHEARRNPGPPPQYHDASLDLETQPVLSPQEYYEREKRREAASPE